MRRSDLLAVAANAAFNRGDLGKGVALKALAFQSGAGVRLTNLNRTAKLSAKTSDGGFNVINYAVAAGSQVAISGVSLLKKGVMGVGAALKTFIVANPILAVGAAAMMAGDLFSQWADKVVATNKAYTDFIYSLASVRAEARKDVSGAKILDDWRDAAADLATKLADVRAKMVALDVNDKEFPAKLQELTKTGRTLHGQQKTLDAKLPGIGLSKAEKARVVAETEGRIDLQSIQRTAMADRGDDYTRLDYLHGESARLGLESSMGQDFARAIDSPERFKNHPTALMTLNRHISAIEASGHAAPRSMYEQQATYAKFADTWQEKAKQKVGMDTEIQALDNKIQLTELELVLDKRIAAVKKAGGETATEEAAKQISLLRKQLELAEKQGRVLDAKDLRAQLGRLAGERADARRQASVDRAENAALARGDKRGAQIARDAAELKKMRAEYTARGENPAQADIDFATRRRAETFDYRLGAGTERAADAARMAKNPRGALAIEDAADREKLRQEYKINGMTAAQADQDFNARILGQAAMQQPHIVADSLQSVGGGGRGYGSNPMLVAQQRVVAIGQQHSTLLKIIADNTKGGSGGVMK